MGRFLVRRLIQSALLFFAISSGSFFLIHLTPGGPEAALTADPRATPESIQRYRERLGLDQPLPVQYVKWLRSVALLDFGTSYAQHRPVVDLVASRAWPTFQLGLLSYGVGLLGIPLGVYAARHRSRVGDSLVRLLTVAGSAVPTWWLALTLIVLMNSLLGWFPNGQGTEGPWDWFRHIVVPALLLGLGGVITFTRFVRSGVLEVLDQDYVRTARAKGLPESAVVQGHVLRNALIPVVTLLGYLLPALLAGAIITEYIFNWPGMGRLFWESALSRDYPVLLAMLLLGSLLTILGTLLADLGYALVDPRVRYD